MGVVADRVRRGGARMTATSYLVRSATGLPVASFDTVERALAFRDERAARGVTVTVWCVETKETQCVD